MQFNSIIFLLFFIGVFFGYWFLFSRNLNIQNGFLLLAGYIFYGYADLRFLMLMIGVSLMNFGAAQAIQKNDNKLLIRRLIFLSAIGFNILVLAVFKYFDFFQNGIIALAGKIGFHFSPVGLIFFLPLGISFYIFLSISYVIDVYQKRVTAVRNPVELLLSFSFFPILLAGPIHRPAMLLPQIKTHRRFSNALATDGIKQIIWGLFMKMAIADQVAVYVDKFFTHPEYYSGFTLTLGAVLFTIQIYADFAGYSHLAIGIAKLLGFNIMQNFAYPYFAPDIREFWRRWNISLTHWFRDYVFLPVAYSVSRMIKKDKVAGIRTEFFIYFAGIAITWFLTGLWHGANYTFIIWGMIHGACLLIYHILIKPRKRLIKKTGVKSGYIISGSEYILTMTIVTVAFTFFRANDVHSGMNYFEELFSGKYFGSIPLNLINNGWPLALLILVFFIIEWLGRKAEHPLAVVATHWNIGFRWAFYYLIIAVTIIFSAEAHPFLYFQF